MGHVPCVLILGPRLMEQQFFGIMLVAVAEASDKHCSDIAFTFQGHIKSHRSIQRLASTFFFLTFFYWSIIDLQCCASFRCIPLINPHIGKWRYFLFGCLSQKSKHHSWFLFLWFATFNPSTSLIGSTFKLALESVCLSPSSLYSPVLV